MAKVGGRQRTLGVCGLTKFAQTADGRQVQLHIPKYVQGPVGRACRYADRGCPFCSQRPSALSSHERSCKKKPPPVVAAIEAPPLAAPAIAASPIMMNNNAEEDVEMEDVEEEKKALFFRILVWSLRTLHFLAYRQCQRQNGRAGKSWVKFLI